MNGKQFGVIAATGAVALATSADAQRGAATVKEVIRVVKTTDGGSSGLTDVKSGQALRAGQRVRTGGRSYAGIRFADRSTLRMGELSEVIVAGGGGAETRVVRGRVFADLKSPGSITGGYAVAAVRGTKIEYFVDEETKSAVVNCYEGEVYVGGGGNTMAFGDPTEVTPNSLTFPQLANSERNWVGGEIRFTDGPYSGQVRKISRFDRDSGAITFGAPLPTAFAGNGTGNGHRVLVAQESTTQNMVLLRRNQGTRVRQGQRPDPARSIPGLQFANFERNSYIRIVGREGNLDSYVGSDAHDAVRQIEAGQETTLQEGRGNAMEGFIGRDGGGGGGPRDDCGCDDFFPDPPGKGRFGRNRFGALAALMGPRGGRLTMGGGIPGVASAAGSALGPRLVQAGGAAGGRTSSNDPMGGFRPESRVLPNNIGNRPTDPGTKAVFLVEPFGFASDENDALGTRIRTQFVSGEAFFEFGYRYLLLDGQSQHDVSEAFVNIRGKHGDLIVGRQHLFLRPTNNLSTTTLLGLDASDAAVYEFKSKQGQKHQVGYLFDTLAYGNGGEKGGFARSQFALGRGTIGGSLLISQDEDAALGYTLDFQQPIVRNVLDFYFEAGQTTKGRRITTAGAYLPIAFNKLNLDTFLEYGRRDGREELITLRIRRNVGRGLVLLFFVDNSLKDSFFQAGGGAIYTHQFR